VLPAWRSLLAKDRARILRRWADLMLEERGGLARLLTAEQGKPLAESRAEIAYGGVVLRVVGEEGKRIYGDTIPTYCCRSPHRRHEGPDRRHGRHHAMELPAAMPTRKSAPALAPAARWCLKPAEQTPLSALAIAQLGLEPACRRRLPDRHGRGRGRTADRRRDDVEFSRSASSASPARPRVGKLFDGLSARSK